MSVLGVPLAFVGPVGVGMPARVLQLRSVGMCVRECASVGVHVLGVRGSV